MILPLLCSSNFNNIHPSQSFLLLGRWLTTSIMKWLIINISSSSLTHVNTDKKDHLGCTSSTIADSVWTEALWPPKWYWFHHSKGHSWCWFPFFFIVSPPNLLTRWALPLLLPHANPSQCSPPGYTAPTAWCASSFGLSHPDQVCPSRRTQLRSATRWFLAASFLCLSLPSTDRQHLSF